MEYLSVEDEEGPRLDLPRKTHDTPRTRNAEYQRAFKARLKQKQDEAHAQLAMFEKKIRDLEAANAALQKKYDQLQADNYELLRKLLLKQCE